MIATSDQQSVPSLQIAAAASVAATAPLAEWLHGRKHHHPPGEFLPDTTVLRI
jgi:hypothetical protein